MILHLFLEEYQSNVLLCDLYYVSYIIAERLAGGCPAYWFLSILHTVVMRSACCDSKEI